MYPWHPYIFNSSDLYSYIICRYTSEEVDGIKIGGNIEHFKNKNNRHFCIQLTQGSILQSLREGGLTLYKAIHAILSNTRTTTWGLDYYQKTLTMKKPLCFCGWCIYNHHNKSKIMNISCIHSDNHWLKLKYLISVWSKWFQNIIEMIWMLYF